MEEPAGSVPLSEVPADPVSPLVAVAKDTLSAMCTGENTMLWHVCTPSSSSVDEPPSRKSFEIQQLGELDVGKRSLLLPVVDTIGKALKSIFSPPTPNGRGMIHNSSFWAKFFRSLLIDLSGGLMVLPEYVRNEAEVRKYLLTPLLENVAHCISMMLLPEAIKKTAYMEYFTVFSLEAHSEVRRGKKGQKPRVDYSLTAFVGEEPLYVIPVEGKLKLGPKDMAQLSHYLSTMAMDKRAGIGMIIDDSSLHFAFSVLSMSSEDMGEMPLPVVLVTPSLSWRSGTAINRSTCVAMCLVQLFEAKRTSVDINTWKHTFGDQWIQVEKMARAVAKDKFTPDPRHPKVTYDIFNEIETLKAKVKALEESQASSPFFIPSPRKKIRCRSPPV
jgi:hypothetical protein